MDADAVAAHDDIGTVDRGAAPLGDGPPAAGGGLGGVHRGVFAGDDHPAGIGIIQVGIVFRDVAMAAGRVDRLMQGAGQAEDRHPEDIRRVADRLRHMRLPRCHPIERTMRLDVVQRHALGREEARKRPDLIDQAGRQFLPPHRHLPPAEALQIRQGGVRAHRHPMRLGQPHRRLHLHRIGGMEAAGDVGDIDQRHQCLVVADPVQAEALAHVAIDGRHGAHSLQGCSAQRAWYFTRSAISSAR